MSAQATSWAWQVDLEDIDLGAEHGTVRAGAQRLVLVALADHAWPDGTHAYPGVERIARMTRLSVRHVQRCLRCLQQQEVIVVERDARGTLPTMYALAVDNSSEGCRHDTGGVKPRHPRGVATTPKPIVNPGSLGDSGSDANLTDECGCRWAGEHYERCAEHGGHLTAGDRERIMRTSVPPITKEAL